MKDLEINIDSVIKNLDSEIKKIEDGEQRVAALERLKAVAKIYEGEDAVVWWKELAEDFKEDMQTVGTGWNSLNELLRGGFRLRQLVALSAYAKSGKTSFLIDMTSKMMELHPLWLTFEEDVEELMEKFHDRGDGIPEFVSPKAMRMYDLKWVEAKIIEAIAKYSSQVIVIDHLDHIVPYNSDNRADRIAQAMRELKFLAKKWGILIILACHITKTQKDKEPSTDEIRGSAAIIQEADTVMMLWRETKKEGREWVVTNNVNVSIQLARRGKPGNVKMVFNNGRFLEEDWTHTEADVEFERKW